MDERPDESTLDHLGGAADVTMTTAQARVVNLLAAANPGESLTLYPPIGRTLGVEVCGRLHLLEADGSERG